MTIWLTYAAIGAVSGLLAGLLGVGGGMIIVPLLSIAFASAGILPEHIQHLALGTSLATIVFTAIASARTHHQLHAVLWPAVTRIAVGIVVGTFSGTWLATRLSSTSLKIFFVIFLVYVAIQMLLDFRPKPTRQLPGTLGMFTIGAGIGFISSLVGIGGGTMSVPFLAWCNLPMHLAIGTSAAIGFPIAAAGAAGYIVNGWHTPGLPPHSLGFVYLPALLGVATASMLTAPLGARLAHRVPVKPLKRFFALFLLAVALRIAFGLR